ncbi:MAG: hypoxanthine-guanine phosphoribosyltransferase [Lysobacterales bacterium]
MPDLNHLLPPGSTLIHSQDVVSQAYDSMASQLNQRFPKNHPLVMLTIMNGAMLPGAELASRLHMDLRMDYLHATRYEGESGVDTVTWLAKPRHTLKEFSVLVVDDILDEGHTLSSVLEYCRQAGASEVLSAVLVEKIHGRRQRGIEADVVGLTVPDVYVFGCGMDFRGRLRHLSGIYGLPA